MGATAGRHARIDTARPVNITPILLAGLLVADQASAESIRFATFNASMSRGAAGELAAALRDGNDPQIAGVAAIIRAVDPDVIWIDVNLPARQVLTCPLH